MSAHPSPDSPEYETHRDTCDTRYGTELAEIAENESANQPSPERIRTLLTLTNAATSLTQFVTLLSASLPDEIKASEDWQFFTRELPGRVLEMCIPVYQKHVDPADLEAVIEFFQSPVGQRWVAALPALMTECSAFAPQLVSELLEGRA